MIDDGLCLVVGVEARCDPEPPILVDSIEMDIGKTAGGGKWKMENGQNGVFRFRFSETRISLVYY
jgi:hypothetical protein